MYTSQSWANRIVKQFPLGAKVTAYVNPRSPANAYLFKHYGSFPYAMCLAGILCLLGSAAVWREHRLAARRIDPPTRCDDGWYRLALPLDRRRAAGVAIAAGIVVELLGFPVWAHYWWVAQPPTGVLFILCVIAFHVFGYAIIIYGAYQLSVANKYNEATICVSAAEPAIGDFLDVRVEQVIRVAGVIESLAVTVLCVEMQSLWAQMRKHDDEKRVFEHTETALQGTKIDAGENLIANFEFVLPEVVPPSTLSQARGGELVKWRFEVKTQLRDQSVYKCKVPIVVRSAAALEQAAAALA